MHCDGMFETAVRDSELGGRNDWVIEETFKYPSGGFMVKATRKLRTRDRFDWQLDGEPLKVIFGLHNSEWDFTVPEKTGFRGFKKYYETPFATQ